MGIHCLLSFGRASYNPRIPESPCPSRSQGRSPPLCGRGRKAVSAEQRRHCSSGSRGTGPPPGWPLGRAADATRASRSHCLAWKQGFQKHTFLVNKPQREENKPRSEKGTPECARPARELGLGKRAGPCQRGAQRPGRPPWHSQAREPHSHSLEATWKPGVLRSSPGDGAQLTVQTPNSLDLTGPLICTRRWCSTLQLPGSPSSR